MLRELSIRNIALIENMTLSFDGGFCALSGETGAGKSIIVDAVELILGGRADKELVRAGSDGAYVEALIDANDAVVPVLEEYGIECPDGMLVLSRELNAAGRGACRVNGRLQSAAVLRRVTAACVNLHGQNRLAEVLEEKNHLSLLDSYAGDTAMRDAVSGLFLRFSKTKKELSELCADEAETLRLADMLAFAKNEIDSVAPKPEEEDELAAERKLISESEKVSEALQGAYSELADGAKDAIARAVRHLAEISALDPKFEKMRAALDDSYYTIEDIVYELADEKDAHVFDEARLNKIEDRLAKFSALKRKYGGSIENVIAYREEAARKLETLQNSDEAKAALEKQLAADEAELAAACKKLTSARKKAAKAFSQSVIGQLADLGMKNARFDVEFLSKPYAPDGTDEVRFIISVNPGQPPRPLSRVVSGGEASRIMLAIKCILAERDGVDTLIFDEIDAGISGQMAQVVARKLAGLAKTRQVICVTHLPQLAAIADANYLVQKTSDAQHTEVDVKHLSDDALTQEVARLSGGILTQKALEHAAELIAEAREFKKSIV